MVISEAVKCVISGVASVLIGALSVFGIMHAKYRQYKSPVQVTQIAKKQYEGYLSPDEYKNKLKEIEQKYQGYISRQDYEEMLNSIIQQIPKKKSSRISKEELRQRINSAIEKSTKQLQDVSDNEDFQRFKQLSFDLAEAIIGLIKR